MTRIDEFKEMHSGLEQVVSAMRSRNSEDAGQRAAFRGYAANRAQEEGVAITDEIPDHLIDNAYLAWAADDQGIARNHFNNYKSDVVGGADESKLARGYLGVTPVQIAGQDEHNEIADSIKKFVDVKRISHAYDTEAVNPETGERIATKDQIRGLARGYAGETIDKNNDAHEYKDLRNQGDVQKVKNALLKIVSFSGESARVALAYKERDAKELVDQKLPDDERKAGYVKTTLMSNPNEDQARTEPYGLVR